MNSILETEKEQQFFLCDCSTEGILVTKYKEDKEVYLAIYTIGQFIEKPSLFERLKYAWYHIRTGKKYEDHVILTTEKANELSNFLKDE
jgi:hypothetical protein